MLQLSPLSWILLFFSFLSFWVLLLSVLVWWVKKINFNVIIDASNIGGVVDVCCFENKWEW